MSNKKNWKEIFPPLPNADEPYEPVRTGLKVKLEKITADQFVWILEKFSKRSRRKTPGK